MRLAVTIERAQGKYLPMLRLRARIMAVCSDRLVLVVEGEPHLADFSRDTGQGRAQPQHGDQRTARKRPGRDWRGWRLSWSDWSRWAADTAGRRA